MKILFFVSSMHAGGAERVAATLSGGWVRQGREVILAPTYTRKGKLFYTLDPQVRIEWVADRLGWLARTPLAPLVKLVALRRLLREERPDVVVSFLTNVNVMVLMASWGLHVPVIVCERTNPAVSTSATPRLQRLRRWLYPRAAMVTVQAEASMAAMMKQVPNMRRLAVVPNPLPPDLPDPVTSLAHLSAVTPASADAVAPGTAAAEYLAPQAGSAPIARRRLVAMGRFVPSKRYAGLIRIFERLAPRFPEWDLFIWGDGPLRKELEAGVAAAGLVERIQLPGRTATPWKELQASDLFVLTSEVEGFPNALIEAMALGLPCVSVDCPSGPKEITRSGQDALLVPLNDEAALEQALAGLMADPAARARLAEEGAKSVRQRYGLEQVLAHWDGLFREVGVHAAPNSSGV